MDPTQDPGSAGEVLDDMVEDAIYGGGESPQAEDEDEEGEEE